MSSKASMEKKEYCKVTVHWDNKSTGKLDTRILIFRLDRLEIAVLKGQVKQERTVHYLDIRRVDTGDENRASITLASGECLQFACTLEADLMRIVCHLVASVQFHLPQLRTASQQLMELRVPQAWKLDGMVAEHLEELGRPGSDKCGHFGAAYEFFCRYTGAEVRDEIKWDVETIYFSQGSRAFTMADFSHFGQADFAVILAAISFNDYFTVLSASGVKFSQQMIKFMEMMLTYNTTLLELHLSNCGLKCDALKALATAIAANSNCRIKVLDLSNNQFGDDKAVGHLCALLSTMSGNLERLNLSHCGLSAKELDRVCESLSQPHGPPPLRHLVIDGNAQKGDASTLVQRYIAKASNLEHLSCVGCDFNLDSFSHAFMRGLIQCVTYLDLSGNHFCNSRRPSRTKDQPLLNKDWGQIFSRCLRLRLLRLNNCRLPPQAVSDLLSGLGSNSDLQCVSLEMAGNGLGAAGAQVLCSCLNSCSIKCLESLDLSDNAFDSEVNSVVEAVCHSSVRHLSIGGNNFRTKGMKIVEEFSELVTDSKCSLNSLSVRDARLRERLVVLLNAVGQCRNLARLDVTGNGMQGLGAKFLAKSLYLNSSLAELQLDDNQIGLAGLRDIAEALQFNSSLRALPVPALDVARMLAESAPPAGVQEALAALQRGLLKNFSATYQVTGRDYRLQSELGSYAFSFDHLVGRLDTGLKALGSAGSDPEAAECERTCRAAMQDALSARYLLTGLSDVADARPAEAVGRCVREELPAPLLAAASADLKGTQEAMLQFLATECPNAFKTDPRLSGALRSRLDSDQGQFTAASVLALLEKSTEASVASKLSSLQLNSALLMNDCMQEAIGHNLQQAEQALNKMMRSKMLQPSLRRGESQPAGGDSSPPPAQTSPRAAAAAGGAGAKQRNNRPISVFGGNKAGRGDGDIVEISLDDSDAPRGATAQPLPRRPVGSNSRRLPKTALPRKTESPLKDDASGDEEHESEFPQATEDAEPVFEKQAGSDEDRDSGVPPMRRLEGARWLPFGAVPLMGMGQPPPPRTLSACPPAEDAASAAAAATETEAARPTPKMRQPSPGQAQTMVAISREDLARTVLRKADIDGAAQPPVPSPKPKSKERPKEASVLVEDGRAESPARSKSTNDEQKAKSPPEAKDKLMKSLPTAAASKPDSDQ